MAASVWKGHLIFGMVSFPIRLFSAARSETISFNLLHKEDHSRIRQVTYCALEDKPIPRTDTVKGYKSGPGWDACTGLGTPDGAAILSKLITATAGAAGGTT